MFGLIASTTLLRTSILQNSARAREQEVKCPRCAELSGCYKGQNGGKPNCPCFSPKE